MGVKNWQVVPDDWMNELVQNAIARKNGGAVAEKGFNLGEALRAGQALPILNADGEVVGFDWGNLETPKGLTTDEMNAYVTAQLQGAALQAQIAQQQAGVQTLKDNLSEITSDKDLATMSELIAKYIADPLSLPSTYKTDASAVNAWANQLQKSNAADASRRGVAGSAEIAARDRAINMNRGSELDKAYARDKTNQAQFEQAQRAQTVNLLSTVYGQKTAPRMNFATAVANILANSSYAQPNVTLPSKSSTNYVAFGGANA